MYIVSLPEGITAIGFYDNGYIIRRLGGNLTDSITSGQHQRFSIVKTEIGSQMA